MRQILIVAIDSSAITVPEFYNNFPEHTSRQSQYQENIEIIMMNKFALRRRCYLFMLNKLRIPRVILTPLVRTIAICLNPIQHFKRKQMAGTISSGNIEIPENDGFFMFGPNDLPNTKNVVKECLKIFRKHHNSGDIEAKVSNVPKAFLVSSTTGAEELMANSTIREFILSDAVLSAVSNYFGTIPILSNVSLLWSPPNDTEIKSQKYHFDAEDFRQLKIFVNISEVTPDTGPFTFLNAELSDKVRHSTGYVGGKHTRLEDDPVANLVDDEQQLTVTGPTGAGIIVDTSRCLHFGSRGNTKERLVLLVHFLDYFSPKIEPEDWSDLASTFSGELDNTRHLILRC